MRTATQWQQVFERGEGTGSDFEREICQDIEELEANVRYYKNQADAYWIELIKIRDLLREVSANKDTDSSAYGLLVKDIMERKTGAHQTSGS